MNLDFKLNLQTSDFTSGLEQAESDLKSLQDLADIDGNIDISGIDDAESKLRGLDDVSTKVNVEDGDLDSAKRKKEDLEEPIDLDINADTGILDGLKDSLGGAFEGGFLGGLIGGGAVEAITAGVGALVSGLSAAASAGLDLNRAIGDLQAKTGATAKEMEGLRDASREAFRAGVGESLAEATDIIGDVQNRLGDFLNPQELGKFTGQAQALANTFDKDVNEVIAKSEPLIKQFGLTGDEAFNLLSAGLQKANTPSDDFLDTIAEYAPLVRQAGFEADTFTQKLITAGEEGSFNLDKVGDSIKEAQIRINAGDFADPFNELSASATGAEKAVIDSVNSIANRAAQGDISIRDALKFSANEVNEAIDAGEISQALGDKLLAGIAGTPAEDLGSDLFGKIFGADIPQDEINKTFQEAGNSVSQAIGQYTSFEAVTREFELVFEEVSRALVVFADNVIAPIFGAISVVIGGIKDAFADAFGGLGDILGEGGTFDVLETYRELLASLGTIVEASIVPIFEYGFGYISNILESVLDALEPLFGLFSDLVGLFNSATQETAGFREILSQIADVLAEVGGFLFDLLIAPLEISINLFASVVTTIADFIAGLFGATDATSIFNDVIDFLSESLTNIEGTISGVRAAFDAFIDAISNFDITEALKALVSGENPFAGITDDISKAYDEGFNEATKIVEESVEDQNEVFDKLASGVDALLEQRDVLSQEELKAQKLRLQTALETAKEEDKITRGQAVKLANALDKIKLKSRKNPYVDAKGTADEIADISDLLSGFNDDLGITPLNLDIGFTGDPKDVISEEIRRLESLDVTELTLEARVAGTEDIISSLDSIRNESDTVLQDLENKKLNLQVELEGTEGQERQRILNEIDNLNSEILNRTIESSKKANIDREDLETVIQNKLKNLKVTTNKEAQEEIKKEVARLNKELEKIYLEDAETALKVEKLKISLLEDENQRALQEKLFNLDQNYQKELKQFEDNEEAKELIRQRYQRDKQAILDAEAEAEKQRIKKANLDAYGEVISAINNLDVSGIIENNNEVKESLNELEETYKNDTEALKEQLRNKEISQEEYYDKLRELETNYTEDSEALNEQRIGFFETFGIATSQILTGISEQFKSNFDAIAADLVEFTGTVDEQKELIGNALSVVGASIAAELGAALAAGELTIGKFVISIIDGVQAAITALLAQLIMQKNVTSFLGFGISGTAEALAIYAGATTILQGAKALIGGAESGVIGLSEATKGSPGATDTIPMMLAEGESVITARGTNLGTNRKMLDHINKGGRWEDFSKPSQVMDTRKMERSLKNIEYGIMRMPTKIKAEVNNVGENRVKVDVKNNNGLW